MSFNEIRIKTIRAAQNLQKRGYEPKQVFGLMAKNSHHVAPIVFASICIGCPINTLDPTFGKTELIYMLKTTKPALMFCDVEVYDLVAECLAELKNDAKIVTFGGSTDGADSVENLLAETNTEIEFSLVHSLRFGFCFVKTHRHSASIINSRHPKNEYGRTSFKFKMNWAL